MHLVEAFLVRRRDGHVRYARTGGRDRTEARCGWTRWRSSSSACTETLRRRHSVVGTHRCSVYRHDAVLPAG